MSETRELNIVVDGIVNVASSTNVVRLADTLYLAITKDRILPTIKTIGSDAISQMVKALTRTRARLLTEGIDIYWYSYWQTVVGERDGKKLSQIVTKVETRYVDTKKE